MNKGLNGKKMNKKKKMGIYTFFFENQKKMGKKPKKTKKWSCLPPEKIEENTIRLRKKSLQTSKL